VNRQVNYIIYAILLSLSLPIGYYFIDKIVAAENASLPQPEIKLQPGGVPIPPKSVAVGKNLFMTKCASCHAIFKDLIGPGIAGFEERGPWHDRNNLYEWIKNPAMFMQKDLYTKSLKQKYSITMQSFPELTNQEIDVIVEYVNYVVQFGKDPATIVD